MFCSPGGKERAGKRSIAVFSSETFTDCAWWTLQRIYYAFSFEFAANKYFIANQVWALKTVLHTDAPVQ